MKENTRKEPRFRDDTGLLEWLSGDRAVVKFFDEAAVAGQKENLVKLVKTWISETAK